MKVRKGEVWGIYYANNSPHWFCKEHASLFKEVIPLNENIIKNYEGKNCHCCLWDNDPEDHAGGWL